VLGAAVLGAAVASAAVLDAAVVGAAVLDAAVLDAAVLGAAVLDAALVPRAAVDTVVADTRVADVWPQEDVGRNARARGKSATATSGPRWRAGRDKKLTIAKIVARFPGSCVDRGARYCAAWLWAAWLVRTLRRRSALAKC